MYTHTQEQRYKHTCTHIQKPVGLKWAANKIKKQHNNKREKKNRSKKCTREQKKVSALLSSWEEVWTQTTLTGSQTGYFDLPLR